MLCYGCRCNDNGPLDPPEGSLSCLSYPSSLSGSCRLQSLILPRFSSHAISVCFLLRCMIFSSYFVFRFFATCLKELDNSVVLVLFLTRSRPPLSLLLFPCSLFYRLLFLLLLLSHLLLIFLLLHFIPASHLFLPIPSLLFFLWRLNHSSCLATGIFVREPPRN